MPTTTSSASVSGSLRRRAMPTCLMVTGPVTKNMRDALERTYHAIPNPKWVVAVGRLRPGWWLLCRQLRGGRRGIGR